jgi:hypothetical protein
MSWSLLNPLGRVHRGTLRGDWIISQCSFWSHRWHFSHLVNSGVRGNRWLRSHIRSSWSDWGLSCSDLLAWTCFPRCHWDPPTLWDYWSSFRGCDGISDFVGWRCPMRTHLVGSRCLRLVMKWSIPSSMRINRLLGFKRESLDALHLIWGRCSSYLSRSVSILLLRPNSPND